MRFPIASCEENLLQENFFFQIERSFLQSLNGNSTFIYLFILYAEGWNTNLLPIQLAASTNIIDTCHQLSGGTNKEHYLNAVNYLRVAIYSSPPLLPALVPFVQVLNFYYLLYAEYY